MRRALALGPVLWSQPSQPLPSHGLPAEWDWELTLQKLHPSSWEMLWGTWGPGSLCPKGPMSALMVCLDHSPGYVTLRTDHTTSLHTSRSKGWSSVGVEIQRLECRVQSRLLLGDGAKGRKRQYADILCVGLILHSCPRPELLGVSLP